MVVNPFEAIERDIIEKLKESSSLVIGIDGMSGSGKTTLANYLKETYFARVIHMDDFFLQDDQRTPKRLGEIGGNIDYQRFYQEVVLNIKDGKDIVYHQYDCQTKTMTQSLIEKDYHFLVIEGAYALKESFRSIYDLSYLIFIDPKTQEERIKIRNKNMFKQFMDVWIPMENKYIDALNLKDTVTRVLHIKG